MANDTTGRIWVLDTAGFITNKPVKIARAYLVPGTAADEATLKYFFEGSATVKSTKDAKSTTISATNVFTSTGNFTASDAAAGDGLVVEWTNTGNNVATYYVASASPDNAVTLGALAGGTMTNESTKLYSWKVYQGHTAMNIRSVGTDKPTEWADEIDVLPCLVLSAISSGAKLYLHIA